MRAFWVAVLLLAGCAPAAAQPIAACNDPGNLNPNSCTAYFEFAGASGTGMGTACACANPTGAKGETMTFTRASSGTCLKTIGTAPQAIANGDMVTCASGQARVMPGTDGTGINGLLVEGARTNLAPQSQAIDNVAWSRTNSAAAAPTVTADQAVAPDGTTTADRVQIPLVSSGWSLIQSAVITAAATNSGSLFVKGNGTSGTLSVFFGARSCVPCAYNSTSWTRCTDDNVATGATNFNFGNDVTDCGGGPYSAQDIFVWGVQVELGAYTSSYIATTAAAVTRSAETASLSVTLPASPTFSFAASLFTPTSVVASNEYGGTLEAHGDSSNRYEFAFPNGGNLNTFYFIGSAGKLNSTGAAPKAFTASTNTRVVSFYSGGVIGGICVNGSCTTTAPTTFTPFTGAADYFVGSYLAGTFQSDAVTKQICLDVSDARCR